MNISNTKYIIRPPVTVVLLPLAFLLLLSTSAHAQHLRGASGTKLGLAAGTVLSVPGNLVHAGSSTFDTTSFLVLSGTSSQDLSGISSVDGLTLSGGGDVVLKNNLSLTGRLALYGGRLLLGDYDLTLPVAGGINGTPSSSAMVVTNGSGAMIRNWNGMGNYHYPVGDIDGTADYSPIIVSITSGSFSSAQIGVRVVDAKHPQNSSTTDYLTRWWELEASGVSGFSGSVTGTYVNADVTGTESNLYTGIWTGSGWQILSNVTVSANIAHGAISSFGDVTAGEAVAVPVELIAFSGVCKGSAVILQWETATELNSQSFDVERLEGGEWQVVATVAASGNSQHPRRYHHEDALSPTLLRRDALHYRLKQIDRDGSWEYSAVVQVQLAPKATVWKLREPFPNPFRQHLTVDLFLPEEATLCMSVHDLLGREVHVVQRNHFPAGSHIIPLNTANLRPGIYILRAESEGEARLQRVIRLR